MYKYNSIYCVCTNLDSVACNTPRLQGKGYCIQAANLLDTTVLGRSNCNAIIATCISRHRKDTVKTVGNRNFSALTLLQDHSHICGVFLPRVQLCYTSYVHHHLVLPKSRGAEEEGWLLRRDGKEGRGSCRCWEEQQKPGMSRERVSSSGRRRGAEQWAGRPQPCLPGAGRWGSRCGQSALAHFYRKRLSFQMATIEVAVFSHCSCGNNSWIIFFSKYDPPK